MPVLIIFLLYSILRALYRSLTAFPSFFRLQSTQSAQSPHASPRRASFALHLEGEVQDSGAFALRLALCFARPVLGSHAAVSRSLALPPSASATSLPFSSFSIETSRALTCISQQSPHLQLHHPHPQAHSPLSLHSPSHHYQQQQLNPTSTTAPHDELTRRNTAPASSPRRGTFGNEIERRATPTPQGGRVRARTEPLGDLEAVREMRERGHARKSSAYAALAALSGLPSHPSSGRGAVNGGYTTAARNGTPGSTPPLSADVRDDADASGSESDLSEGGSRERRRRRGGKLLTPPATPPRCEVVVVAHEHGHILPPGLGHDDDEDGGGVHRPAFNARKASAQCRQLEGYVSFAAVEGLGEPPSPAGGGEEGFFDDESPRKRGSLSNGIATLWRGGFWSS
ncbi:hypothetical protein DFH07DRAFT_992052 [Mycena maculata]|uniref:Uncharacterized protein n=1 Tax=Mycena maculata TaxID=230809 RepID=A0AAD7MTE8_9AGAR|nr:hypothetical protein DFH07DRAFT_992052 [Mycena maculata]